MDSSRSPPPALVVVQVSYPLHTAWAVDVPEDLEDTIQRSTGRLNKEECPKSTFLMALVAVPLLMFVAGSVCFYVWSLLYEDLTWIQALLALPLLFIIWFLWFFLFAIVFQIPHPK